MSKQRKPDSKVDVLKKHGAFNRAASKVQDELFQSKDFFDARDLVQAKYEMLRRVDQEGVAVKKASKDFGFSRPSFYEVQSSFKKAGLVGLLPKKRGPKQAHKLTEPVLKFIEKALINDSSLTAIKLANLIYEKFLIEVHPRSIERALERWKKKEGQ